MSLRYKKKKIVLHFDEKKTERYVASNVLVGSLSYEKLCNEVNQRTGIHRAMVDIVSKGLIDAMMSFLEEGFSVKLGEFGSFCPSINAKSQDKEEDVNVSTIIRKKILFSPGTRFKKMLDVAGVGLVSNEITTTGNGSGDSGGDQGGEAPDPTV